MNSSMRILHRITRFYTFNSPIGRGKYRLAEASLRFGGELPESALVRTVDGRFLEVSPADIGYRFLYFLGVYEPGISAVISKSIHEGDCCFDMGANLGCHTTLMMKLAGESGSVHGFEPVPKTFERLLKNVELNQRYDNVYLNKLALGESEGAIELILFDGLPDGHAKIGTSDAGNATKVSGKMITLDSYLEGNQPINVDFAKVDIEGSELMMLRGAEKLFEQEFPPVLIIEMALATSTEFDYVPNDIIEFIRSKRNYDFYAIDDVHGGLSQIMGFRDSDIGANVLCLPADIKAGRRDSIGI